MGVKTSTCACVFPRFMWQLCSSIPSTLPDPKAVSLMTAKVEYLTVRLLFLKKHNVLALVQDSL